METARITYTYLQKVYPICNVGYLLCQLLDQLKTGNQKKKEKMLTVCRRSYTLIFMICVFGDLQQIFNFMRVMNNECTFRFNVKCRMYLLLVILQIISSIMKPMMKTTIDFKHK